MLKTELLVFHHKTNECSEVPQAVVVGDSSITSAKTMRDLGVIFDTTLSLNKHVTNMSLAAYYHLRARGRIRRYLDQHSNKQLARAFGNITP